MGGTSSQPMPSSAPAADEVDGEQEEQAGGFFMLSESLQEQMALEFQNEQVVKMFGKQMEKIGEQKADAYKKALEQKAVLERRMNEFRQKNAKVQDRLNSTIEGFEDKFTDGSNILEYDIARLDKKYLGAHGTKNHVIPCFAERTDIAACLLNENKSEVSKNDPFACDMLIKTLTRCADKTITTEKARNSQ
mmetsp:Transcript_10620/g.25563  ORF Transcript_10620/g.25563 Transcript_10620/m.25563 type:complete len:191 (-) Transcript_10620:85-657(-)